MKNTEPARTVNLFPVIVLLIANLIGVCIAVIMLYGLHNKTKAPITPQRQEIVAADRIGEIKLDRDRVRINLMSIGAKPSDIQKVQEISLPQEGFLKGFSQMQVFIDQLVEQGIVKRNEEE